MKMTTLKMFNMRLSSPLVLISLSEFSCKYILALHLSADIFFCDKAGHPGNLFVFNF